jgi:hypothetical protein
MKALLLATVAALSLTACATQLNAAGAGVRLIPDSKRASCQFLRTITAKSGQAIPAMNDALNQAAAAGANSLFVVTNEDGFWNGASVTGEALKCPT